MDTLPKTNFFSLKCYLKGPKRRGSFSPPSIFHGRDSWLDHRPHTGWMHFFCHQDDMVDIFLGDGGRGLHPGAGRGVDQRYHVSLWLVNLSTGNVSPPLRNSRLVMIRAYENHRFPLRRPASCHGNLRVPPQCHPPQEVRPSDQGLFRDHGG